MRTSVFLAWWCFCLATLASASSHLEHPSFVEALQCFERAKQAGLNGDLQATIEYSEKAASNLDIVRQWEKVMEIFPIASEWEASARERLKGLPSSEFPFLPKTRPGSAWRAANLLARDYYSRGFNQYTAAQSNWDPVTAGLCLVASITLFRRSEKTCLQARRQFFLGPLLDRKKALPKKWLEEGVEERAWSGAAIESRSPRPGEKGKETL
ncbi:MAG: hypothetical protein J0L75_04480 [Spirochaetes bacterium]|nr:hypothetical protein [Spirochaetota bacterium]